MSKSTSTDALLAPLLALRLTNPYVRPASATLSSHAFVHTVPGVVQKSGVESIPSDLLRRGESVSDPAPKWVVVSTTPLDLLRRGDRGEDPAPIESESDLFQCTGSIYTSTSSIGSSFGPSSQMNNAAPQGIAATPCTIQWHEVVKICCDVYEDHGIDCTELMYQNAVFFKLYTLGVPSIRERNLYVKFGDVFVHRGRIDLEIGSKFLLEFKISPSTPNNIRAHTQQLKRYIRTYNDNGQHLEKAAVVYFSNGQVRVVEVSTNDGGGRYTPY